ncbi:hypothetical protein [Nocardiopsis sp. LOL_012]|uniref:hypothetical protein n=1 Tax=Nocardiopsis sp. LOL_012 TaxID=3345409 RepID=UPI003A858DC2
MASSSRNALGAVGAAALLTAALAGSPAAAAERISSEDELLESIQEAVAQEQDVQHLAAPVVVGMAPAAV